MNVRNILRKLDEDPLLVGMPDEDESEKLPRNEKRQLNKANPAAKPKGKTRKFQ